MAPSGRGSRARAEKTSSRRLVRSIRPTQVPDPWARDHPRHDPADRGEPRQRPLRCSRDCAGMAQQYRFFHWHLEFPGIFTVPDSATAGVDPTTGWQGGFTCVVGNPPWETLSKLRTRSSSRPSAVTTSLKPRQPPSGADDPRSIRGRRRPIRGISDRRAAPPTQLRHLVRAVADIPLTATGKINTYSVFAETFRTITAPAGNCRDNQSDWPGDRQDDGTLLRRHTKQRPTRRILRLRERSQNLSRRPSRLPVRRDRDGRDPAGSAANAICVPQQTCCRRAGPQIRTRGRGGTRTEPEYGNASHVPDQDRMPT